MSEDDALFRAVLATPADTDARRVYADWLDDHDRPGGAYLRAEADVAGGAAARLELLRHFLKLPAAVRHRVTQPDFLLAPPAPFQLGWYKPNARKPTPYRSLANLPAEAFLPRMPWLSSEGVEPRLDQLRYEGEENRALAVVVDRAKDLKLTLPPGFETFAKDFPRRNAVSLNCEWFLHDAALRDFPRVGEGHVILFFGDMNYGASPQLAWALYVVPRIAWHCVVAFALPEDDVERVVDDPDEFLYVAPSFQAFLYRWMHGAV